MTEHATEHKQQQSIDVKLIFKTVLDHLTEFRVRRKMLYYIKKNGFTVKNLHKCLQTFLQSHHFVLYMILHLGLGIKKI